MIYFSLDQKQRVSSNRCYLIVSQLLKKTIFLCFVFCNLQNKTQLNHLLSTSQYFCSMEEIKNKVKESGLIQMDLADFKPQIAIEGIDLAAQLWQGFVLREKDFRTWIQEEDWSKYTEKAIYIHCSTDAIVPTWAFMLVASALVGIAKTIVVGNKSDLEKQLIAENIEGLDLENYNEKRLIIKGCSDISCPEFAMVTLLNKLQPVVLSIMYGEPCSTVPVFKRKK